VRWLSILVVLAACRVGFDDGVVGLADVPGVMVSAPGALVLEDGRYDIAPALDGAGYATAWFEFPRGDRTLVLEIATVGEDGRVAVPPRVVEIVPELPGTLRMATGRDSYLVAYEVAGRTVLLALDASGAVLGRSDMAFYPLGEVIALPDGFGLAYADNGEIRLLHVDPRANPGATTTVELATGPGGVTAMRLDSGAVAIAWTDTRTGTRQIRIAQIDAAGGVVGPSVPLYDTGQPQGNPLLASDGSGGFVAAFDQDTRFPQFVQRFTAAGAPMWPQAALVYDYPHYHFTIDVAASPTGRLGMVWVTGPEALLNNIEFVAIDGGVAAPPSVPAPLLLSDTRYQFCYPELARGTTGFATAFAGEVEGSLGLFVVALPD
jgi:hypothetical protein